MLNLKKVIASICVLAMVLSTVAFGATYTDVAEDSAYYEAVETLNKLDIITGYEDGTFKPEDGVTRAEMAALIARIQGYGATAAGSANTAFADVPASHWASGYVANASGLGIINGYGDGTFGPDEPVLYEQAIKMIMATLGYTPFANENGGYPAGYLAAANRYNVTANVSGGAIGQAACRGTIAQLLVNALDTALMVQSKWNTNGEVEYEIAEGKYNALTGQTEGYKTLMSENLGFVKIRGIVESTSLIDLYSTTPEIDTTEEAEVYIDVKDNFGTENKDFINYYGTGDGLYFVAGTDAEDFLGQSVVAYVKASEGASEKFEIASIAVDSSRNDVLTIALDQFEDYKTTTVGTTTTYEIEYYKDGASKSTFAKLAGNIPLVFNYVGGYNASDLDTKVGKGNKFGGSITLIDNDENKGYDVAFCSLAATAVVKKVTANSITLYNSAKIGGSSSTTKTIYVYPEDETKVVTIYKNGEVINHTDLNEWDILSVYGATTRPDVLVAEVIANEVVGTISATKTSKKSAAGYGAYKVGDAWYDVAEGVYDEGIDAGVGGKFYIDEFGKIAAFIEDSALANGATGSYGYVIAVKADESDFGAAGSCTVKVQMLTADGIEVLTLKNNAKFDNLTLKVGDWSYVANTTPSVKDDITGDDITDDQGRVVETPFDDFVDVTGSVVKYTKDANGNLSTVTTAGYTKGAADADFTTSNIAAGTYKFDAEDISLGKAIDPEATIFVVGNTIDEYAVVKASDLVDLTEYTVNASYQTKKADDADMIVITYNSFNGVSASANVAVISGLSTTTDEDGLTVYAIDYIQDGEEKYAVTTAEVYEDPVNATLTVGDVVKVKTTGDVITKISSVFDFAEVVRPSAVTSAAGVSATIGAVGSTDEVFVGGVVTNYAERSETVTIGGQTYRLSKAVNVYTVDNNGRELEVTAGGAFTSLSEAIYENTTNSNNIVDAKGATIATGLTDAQVQTTYADYVYVRTFEDDVIDVIIVKGYDVIVE